ncbi:MAG TPA: ABC transporter permease, partial [Methylomirabilota bacterium]|nr:ABC transporter permease [Methylomirabilota bacterium]
MEARLTARRAENLLAMVGVPVAVLVFLAAFVLTPGSVDRVLPGTLAIAIVASGLVNLGIATAYERGYGVLKRLGGSPLGRSGLVAAKVAVVMV